jgi:hypothetical protein
MNNVIQGNFQKRFTLEQAKETLEDFYELAMNWEIEELRSTTYNPMAYLSDAHEAYLAVLIHREGNSNPPCPVISLANYRNNKLKVAA